MAVPYSFINPRMQTYQGLKSSVSLAGKSLAKFDTLNAHIRDSVVLAGELVIIGDHSTKSCTSHEAYLMAKAVEVHHMLLIHGMEGDSYIVENYDFLQDILERTSVATGVVTDGWSRHLKNIESSLEEINTLYKSHLSSGKLQNRELFFQKRAQLQAKIQSQLSSYASTGSGLGRNSRIKDMLGLSTKSYLKHGEIARYADTVAGVAKAATIIKRGGYIGVALDVASTSLEIREACLAGDERQCRKARYVEGGKLVGSLGGAAAGTAVGMNASKYLCSVILGAVTKGFGSTACVVLGSATSGWAGGKIGESKGESVGELIYGVSIE
ncbi:hypothetical protein [Pseudomonas sp. NFR16]|uniref:hypothetical protein n=1 Tax=Pseudomonas sp. NFR16 TaxID=1566248 RepID=UPI0008B4B3F6|nr:hypothetical protein [Pseudomonas sp. NFR16]SEJ80179.1 hypothetical protein SAMN03159495_4616 [Pseudomonas sp. NFR16]